MSLPTTATVLGTGAGGLSTAVELSLAGIHVTVADLPLFADGLGAIDEAGGIQVKCPWHGREHAAIDAVSDQPAEAIHDAKLIVVSVPAFGHQAFADILADHLVDGQEVLWVGEGGGSLVLAARLRQLPDRPDVTIGETNSLPYGARVRGPGLITASRKAGGTLVSSLGDPGSLVDHATTIWSWVTPAESVWETVLLNFNAIDHVPPIICNLGIIEGRRGKMLLWGEGGTPAVARIIARLDEELLAIRRRLGLSDERGYADYLVAQGFAEERRDTLYDTLQGSSFANSTFPCGPDALQSRYITEDVPFALVFMSSIGAEVDVPTPTIDSLIHLASIAAEDDFAARGRTLADLDLAGVGVEGLQRAAREGTW